MYRRDGMGWSGGGWGMGQWRREGDGQEEGWDIEKTMKSGMGWAGGRMRGSGWIRNGSMEKGRR